MGNARFYCCFLSTIYTLHKFVPNTHHGTHHHLRVDTLKQDYFWLFRTVPRGGPHCSCHFIIIHRLPILTVKPNGGESCARVPRHSIISVMRPAQAYSPICCTTTQSPTVTVSPFRVTERKERTADGCEVVKRAASNDDFKASETTSVANSDDGSTSSVYHVPRAGFR